MGNNKNGRLTSHKCIVRDGVVYGLLKDSYDTGGSLGNSMKKEAGGDTGIGGG